MESLSNQSSDGLKLSHSTCNLTLIARIAPEACIKIRTEIGGKEQDVQMTNLKQRLTKHSQILLGVQETKAEWTLFSLSIRLPIVSVPAKFEGKMINRSECKTSNSPPCYVNLNSQCLKLKRPCMISCRVFDVITKRPQTVICILGNRTFCSTPSTGNGEGERWSISHRLPLTRRLTGRKYWCLYKCGNLA